MKYSWIWIGLIVACADPSIHITDGVVSEGQESFQIETPGATYIYQKEAGGFSSIYDSEGTDWVQFHASAEATYPQSADSDYRGLPNLVFRSEDGGCGHPGFDKMTSVQLSENQIRSTSKSGKWAWLWTFYPHFAELTIEQVDPETPFWFLYEGPIAGQFSPTTHYWGSNLSGPLFTQPDLVKGPETYGNWQSVYVGDTAYEQVFFVQQLEPDSLADLYTYMGNSMEGNASEDGMLVLGFGRDRAAKPLLTQAQKFRIGFYDGPIATAADHQQILTYIFNLTTQTK